MDSLDKFLYSVAYKFPKGYPDMNNEQDILMLESLLKERGISLSIKEGTKASNTRKAKEALLNSPEGKNAGLVQMSATYRIGNRNKIDKDKFIEIINKVFNSPKLTVYAPEEGPNSSSRFNMFEFEMEGEGLVQLFLAGGANEGEKYEQDLLQKMKSSAGLSIGEIQYEDVKQIFTSLGIDPTKITSEDVNFAGSSSTSRQLSFDGPQEIGSTISDVTIEYPGKIYYLSIKNKKGSAIYNGGNIPFIVQDEDGKVIFDQSKYNNNPLFAEIFDTLGIDSQKIADGLNDYINKTGEFASWESAQGIDLNKVKNLLASSFGYGYWYVREKPGNKIFTYHVATAEDAYKMVGKLDSNSVKIKYPGNTLKGGTKVLEVKIETNSEVLEGGPRVPLVYQIVARNAAGKLLPMRMNIKTNK